MKSKKLTFPVIIFAVAIVAMAAYSVIANIAKKPTVTEGEFPFSITYELDGETVTIDDVYTARYETNGGYTHSKTRVYEGQIGSLAQDAVSIFVLREDADGRIVLDPRLYADYLMGDPAYEYFDGGACEPQIYYYDAQEVEYADEESLAAQGVKLVSWDYPTPIENTFVFSHISRVNHKTAIPTLIIAALALLAILIFVKKEQDLPRRPIDVVSIVCDAIVGVVALPFFTVIVWLIDALGSIADVLSQVFYFTPALTLLGIAASVALRRKGFAKSALIVPLVAPALFAAIIVLDSLL